MFKVLLIQPPLLSSELFVAGAKVSASTLPPLGLAYIAAYLREQGIDCDIVDGIVENFTLEEIARKAADYNLVGVTAVSTYAVRSKQLVKMLRDFLPQSIKIMVGGPHVTVLPKSLLESGADFAVVGEGEATTLELVRYLEKGAENLEELKQIRGIGFFEDKEYVFTGHRAAIDPLDQLPKPARELLPMHLYKSSIARDIAQPSLSLFTSRGCPGVCSFCSKATFGTKVRYFSVERIVAEFFELRDRYGARSIAIWDDNFLSDPSIVEQVCEELISKNYGLPFSVEARVDNVTERTLQILKKAGCSYIAYGVESGSQRVLDHMNKKTTLNTIRETISLTKKVGIPIRGYFMMGFPGETIAEMNETIQFAIELDLELASFTLLVPLPGTLEFNRAQKSGSFDPEYFNKIILPEFNFPDKPVYTPEGMTQSELLNVHRQAYRKLYFRPSTIYKRLISINSFDALKAAIMGGYTLVRSSLKKKNS